MKLPTLYKKTQTGATQVWEMNYDSNSFWSVEGILNGKMTKNSPTICQGKNLDKKNATTPKEQAEKEARAKWQKKLDKGYTQDVEDIGTKKYFEPMLAFKYEDYKSEIKFPVYSQPKLDGIRCIVTKEGMFSRNGKAVISAPHIRRNLEKLFEKFPTLILDGELYTDKLNNDFNKICSLVKRTKPSAEELIESEKMIEYWVYDIFSNVKFSSRNDILNEFLSQSFDMVKIVKTNLCNNQKELDNLYEKYMADGYEGQMVRLDEKYENKRSKFLLKRKEFMDEEYKILDVVEGVGNRAGTAGYMVFKNKTGTEFHSSIKGTFAYLTELLKNKKELIGKMATVKYFNLTPAKIPRFPYVIQVRDYE